MLVYNKNFFCKGLNNSILITELQRVKEENNAYRLKSANFEENSKQMRQVLYLLEKVYLKNKLFCHFCVFRAWMFGNAARKKLNNAN